MGAGGGQRQAHLLGEREQGHSTLRLALDRLGKGRAATRPNLDLGVDQLTGCRLGEQLMALAALVEVLEAVLELEARGVDDREFLFDPDREVGRGLKDLADLVQIEAGGRPLVRASSR